MVSGYRVGSGYRVKSGNKKKFCMYSRKKRDVKPSVDFFNVVNNILTEQGYDYDIQFSGDEGDICVIYFDEQDVIDFMTHVGKISFARPMKMYMLGFQSANL